MWEPLPRTKLSDRLALHLAQEIVSERMRAGDALPAESDLAGRHRLSKVVARESLQTLARAGLVYVQQGKRTIVLPTSDWNPIVPVVQQAFWLEGRAAEFIGNLYEIRRVLETKSVEWAALRADGDLLNRIDARVADMATITRTSQDVVAFLRVDLGFHHTLAVAARNVMLPGLLRDLHTSLLSGWSDPRVAAGDLASLAAQHGAVASALRARDLAGAVRAMNDHLDWAEQNALARAAALAVDAAAEARRAEAIAPRGA